MPAVPKFLASLLLMLALSVTAAAQNRKISIDMQNVTVKEFFAEIEKRSDYTFAYNNSEIDLAARVSVRAVDEEIVAVVDRTPAPPPRNPPRTGGSGPKTSGFWPTPTVPRQGRAPMWACAETILPCQD